MLRKKSKQKQAQENLEALEKSGLLDRREFLSLSSMVAAGVMVSEFFTAERALAWVGTRMRKRALSEGAITSSLRLRSSAGAFLSRTPSIAGNRRTWTWSGWVKLGNLSIINHLFGCDPTTTNQIHCLYVGNDGRIGLYFENTSGVAYKSLWYSSAYFRDPSAHYHVVAQWDTTQVTAANRAKIYVNGTLLSLTLDNVSSGQFPQNYDGFVNSTLAHAIGKHYSGTCADAIISGVHFVDGQVLGPEQFGQIDTLTGQWIPKRYSGTYGTNGFNLSFKNSSSLGALTQDVSGNGNSWTTNNVSLTAGGTYDAFLDCPAGGSSGERAVGNYAILNPFDSFNNQSESNLFASQPAAVWRLTRANIPVPDSGKYYLEFTSNATTSGSVFLAVGLARDSVSMTSTPHLLSGFWGIYIGGSGNTPMQRDGSTSGQPSAFACVPGDVFHLAVDPSNNRAWLGRNGVWWDSSNGNTGDPAAGISPTFSSLPSGLYPALWCNAASARFNAGQRPFAYTPPSGFNSLCTANTPTPTIVNPALCFNAFTYTGDTTSGRTLSVGEFDPDLIWFRSRASTVNSAFHDRARGNDKALFPNLAIAESSITGYMSFGAAGTKQVTVSYNGSGGNTNEYNTSHNYVAFAWRSGAVPGIEILTYTGTLSGPGNVAINHSLGVAPKLVISKSRNVGGIDGGGWGVWHSSLGADSFLYLNENTTTRSSTGTGGGSKPVPTSTQIFQQYNSGFNVTGNTYIAYLFAEKDGFSRMGSYIGNGSADGPFVYCGFKPKWLMVRKTNSADSWVLMDAVRSPVNPVDRWLATHTTDSEYSGTSQVDFLSNGFKLRSTSTGNNASGSTFIFIAFAEAPFKYSTGR